MIFNKDSSFQDKASYVLTNDDRTISREFPVASTNIITLKDPVKTVIYKLLDFLFRTHNQYLGYFTGVNVNRNPKEQDKAYYTRLHSHIKSLISSKTGENINTITYEKFKPSKDSEWVVLYINPNALDNDDHTGFDDDWFDDEDETEDGYAVNPLINSLSDQSLLYENSGSQNMLTAILKIYIKLSNIKELPYHKEYIAQAKLNLNAQAFWLLDVVKTKEKGNFYKVIEPKIWVSSENEIITSISHKRFHSYVISKDFLVSDSIDIFAPNLIGEDKGFVDDANNQDMAMRQISAVAGKLAPDYLVLKDLGKSLLLYENYLAESIQHLCRMAGITAIFNTFEPSHRGRPFITFSDKPIKNKLMVINAIPKAYRDNPYESIDTASLNENINSSALTIQQGFDLVVDLIAKVFSDYDIKYCDQMPDCTYSALDDSMAYLIVQEPKSSDEDYWYSTNLGFEDGMQDQWGSYWRDYLGSSREKYWGGDVAKMSIAQKKDHDDFSAHESLFSYENDFIKLIGRYRKSVKEQIPFYTHPYTLWKIQQIIEGINGAERRAIQGMHLPDIEHLKDIKNASLNQAENWIDTFSVAVEGKPKPKKFGATAVSMLSKIKTHILLKSYLTELAQLPLLNFDGSNKDYTSYAGKYRAYYIRRPKVGKNYEGLFASKMEVLITDSGIEFKSIKFMDSESRLRASEPTLNKKAFERLYDSAFYLIDENDDVLTIYNSLRTMRIMACMPLVGEYKGVTLYGLYNRKCDYRDLQYEKSGNKDASKKISISKNIRDKVIKETGEKLLLSDESLMLAFHTHSSTKDYHHSKNGRGGKEWLYLQDNQLEGLLVYLTNKDDINEKLSKGSVIKNIVVHNKFGDRVLPAEHKLTSLYLNTVSFDVAVVNSFSATSIIETIAKIALLN